MDAMGAWVKIHTGNDIIIKQDIKKTCDQWLPHPMIDTIYRTQSPNQWSISCLIVCKKKDQHGLTNDVIKFLIMGIQKGWRGVEWAQPKCKIRYGLYEYITTSSTFQNQIYTSCIQDIPFNHASSKIVANHLTVIDKDVTGTMICRR